MSRQLRIGVLAIGIFLFAVCSGAGVELETPAPQMVAETEKPKVVAEYCTLWRGCMEDPSDHRAIYRMTRHDLGGGYYEDVYSFKGRIPGLRGMYDATMRIRSYRGLFTIENESRSRTLYSAEELLRDKFFQNDEDQTSGYMMTERRYMDGRMEEDFNQLLSGERTGMSMQKIINNGFFACRGPEWCDPTGNSRRYYEHADATEGFDVWIPVGEEKLELPDGAILTMVFDNFDVRIWYDPESEQIVRSSRRDSYGDYEVERLRVRDVR